tara:strand:- start:70 stop:1008 length:939 start_codon:yes stop_codon:yes gene_type:complete
MRYKKFISSVKILIVIFFLVFTNKVLSEKIEILLILNNEIVTNIDIEKEYNYLSLLNDNIKVIKKKDAIKLAKKSIIKEKVKQIEILKYYNLDEKNEYLENIIRDLYEKKGIKNKKEFNRYLTSLNLNLNEVEQKIKIEIIWNELIYNKFINEIKINKNLLKEQILSQSQEVEYYLISEIFINIENKNEIQNKTIKLIKDINDLGFEQTATLYSDAESAKKRGDLGWVNINLLSPDIKKEIINLKINSVTQPISLGGGLLALKIRDKKKEQKSIDIDAELNKIIEVEKNKKLNQFSNLYFNKIKNNVKVNEL